MNNNQNAYISSNSYSDGYQFQTENASLSQDRAYSNTSVPVSGYHHVQNHSLNASSGRLAGPESELEYGQTANVVNSSHTNKSSQQLILGGAQPLVANPSSSAFPSFLPVSQTTAGNVSATEQSPIPNGPYLRPPMPWNSSSPMTDVFNTGLPGQLSLPSLPPTTSMPPAEPIFPIQRMPEPMGQWHHVRRAPQSCRRLFTSHMTIPPTFSPRQNPQQLQTETPVFGRTEVVYDMVDEMDRAVTPDVCPIAIKFFLDDDGHRPWTCYRRNYWQVQVEYVLSNHVPGRRVYVKGRRSQPEMVHAFAIQLTSRTAETANQPSEPRAIIQHTPKRSKETEREPGRIILSPKQIVPYHDPRYAPYHAQTGFGGGQLNFEPVQPPNTQPPTSHLFERLQFQKATQNNGKRRAAQQYYHIAVELHALLANNDWVRVAYRESERVVVRGRSPGHYKNGRHARTNGLELDFESGVGGGAGSPGGAGGAGGDGDQCHEYNFADPPSGPFGWAQSQGYGQQGSQYNHPRYSGARDSPDESSLSLQSSSAHASPIVGNCPDNKDRTDLSPRLGRLSCQIRMMEDVMHGGSNEDHEHDYDTHMNTASGFLGVGSAFHPDLSITYPTTVHSMPVYA